MSVPHVHNISQLSGVASEAALTDVSSTVDDISTTVTDINADVSGINDSLGQVGGQLTTINTALNNLITLVNDLVGRVEDLEGGGGPDVPVDPHTHPLSDIEGLTATLTDLSSNLLAVSNDVTDLQIQVTNIDDRVAVLEGQDPGTDEPPPGTLFFDDFNYPDGPAAEVLPADRWYIHDHPAQVNDEQQYYSPDAVTVEGGRLVITADAIPTGGMPYRSGLVTTATKFQFLYGRVEIRLRAPGSAGHIKGLWPSLYMLEEGSAPYFGGQAGAAGGDQLVPGWPTSGYSEVDVWEWAGAVHGVDLYHINRHWNTTPGASIGGLGRDVGVAPDDMTEGFHTYGVTWTPDYLAFTYDGAEVARLTSGDTTIPFNPMFLIINFAVGGMFPGAPDGATEWPARYEIDWVRVTPLVQPQSLAELVDEFAPPQTIWQAVGSAGTVNTVDGGVEITTGPTYPSFRTITHNWDLTDASVYAEVSEVPSATAASAQGFLALEYGAVEGQAPAGEIRVGYNGGQLVCEYQEGGAYTTVATLPYDEIGHRFWRMRHTPGGGGGTVTYSTSPDGETWTDRGTVTVAALGFSIAALDVACLSGHYAAETDPGLIRFEGINTSSGVIPSFEKPDLTNTGLTAPGLLTPAPTNTITAPGVYENLEYTGLVEVQASDVTFRNCKFNGPTSLEVLVFIRTSMGATNTILEDCEIDGGGLGTGVAVGYEEYTLRRCYIHNVVDGPRVGTNTVVESCYITGLVTGAGTHNDGLQSTSGSNITVRRNNIINAHAQTSAILIGADLGDISDVLVEDNWLDGGGYTIYAGADPGFTLSRCVIRNNRFGRSAAFGVHQFNPAMDIQFVGNVFDDNDAAIPDVIHP